MRLFTTRSLRPDRPPPVAPLDLAALAAARGRVPPCGGRTEGTLGDRLSASIGAPISCFAEGAEDLDREPTPDAEVDVAFGSLVVRMSFGREARTAWLGFQLGLPVGGSWIEEVPATPSSLERILLGRTLVVPLARVMADRSSRRSDFPSPGEAVREEWLPAGDRPAFPAGRPYRLWAVTPHGRVELHVQVARTDRPSSADSPLDRSLRMAEVRFTVQLGAAAAGLGLTAADLARFEPGDILLTDLPAEGGLPVELACPASATPGTTADPSLLRGRLGLAGHRRAVRLEAWSPTGPSRH